MSATQVRAPGDGAKWFPKVTISKYSPDQIAFAECVLTGGTRIPGASTKLAALYQRLAPSGGTLCLQRMVGGQRHIHGDMLRLVCGEPEDGYAYDEGNQLVNVGLNKIALWITGSSAGNFLTGSGGTNFGYCAVGDSSTAWAATQTDVQAATNKYYNQIDAGYPTANAGPTPGLITVQSTFGGSNANFAWNEWAWGTSTGVITGGGSASQPTTGANDSLVNRKVPASTLGTKGSGASWVFTSTIQFS